MYCNRLVLDKTQEKQCLEEVAEWVSRTIRADVTAEDIVSGTHEMVRSSFRCNIISSFSDFPKYFAVSLQHPDKIERGRYWNTEIGHKQMNECSPIEVTVILGTTDTRSDIAVPPRPTRPFIIKRLAERCTLANGSSKRNLIYFDDSGVGFLKDYINDPERKVSIIIVSPDREQKPLVDCKYLSGLTFGLADTILIVDHRDTSAFVEMLGKRHSAFNGAINIIHPSKIGFMRNRLIMPDVMKDLISKGLSIEGEILKEVAAYHYPIMEKFHTSPIVVREAIISKQIKDYDPDIINIYDEEIESLNSKLKTTTADVDALTNELTEKDLLITELTHKYNSMKHNLNTKESSGSSMRPVVHEPLVVASLNDVTKVVMSVMSNRIILTDYAVKTMENSPYLRYDRVFKAYKILGEELYRHFLLGDPLSDAIDALNECHIEYNPFIDKRNKLFGDYQILYKGGTANLNKHLKIGNSRNPQKTFRIHFDVDVEEKKIVVFVSGKHLRTSKS